MGKIARLLEVRKRRPLTFLSSNVFPRNGLAEHVFDWEGDKPLQKELKDLIIYEMHIRGFTIAAPDVTPKVNLQ